ncbi:methyltransferase domain-containing protein [Patescibacteria group bacterium]
MKYITRNKSILTDKENLEHLYTLKNFPVFMGCVNSSQDEDLMADMVWDICKDTGIIQLRNLIPLEVLYLNQHNDGYGKIWQDHYIEFAKFIKKHSDKDNILEIGGAHDWVAKNYMNICPDVNWTIVEPNPQNVDNSKIKIIKGWFDDKFTYDKPVDTIVHSHVFEHVYNPFEFIKHIGTFLNVGDKHIFTFPNMLSMFEKKYTSCLNFEHSVFLTESVTDYIIQRAGFKILEKQYYKDSHSIFYVTEKVGNFLDDLEIESKYDEYRKLFMDFINYHTDMINDLNKKITSSQNDTYLFGAHIFSQYLIGFGLDTNLILSVLDNSPNKQGKRLYGTDLKVESPKVLAGKGPVNIILKAGIYNDEIKKDILENINSEVIFL